MIARASSDDTQRFTALFSLARLAAYRGAYVQASPQYREALGLAEVLRNTRAVATVRVSLADRAALQGNTEDAVVVYAEAQPLCRRWGMISYVGVIAVRLGVIFRANGAYERAINLYEEACSIWKALGRTSALINTLGTFGWTLLRANRLTEAVDVFQEQFVIAEDVDRMEGVLRGLPGMASVRGMEATTWQELWRAERTWYVATPQMRNRAVHVDETDEADRGFMNGWFRSHVDTRV